MKKGGFDLQTHSIFSDGEYSPLQIMRMAKKQGLAGVVVTDHNTIAHLDETKRAAKQTGLETLEGIEITTNYWDLNLHILGYAQAFKRQTLINGLKRTIAGYERRLAKMLERLYIQERIRVTMRELRKVKPRGELVKFDIYRILVQRYPLRARAFKTMLTKRGALVAPYEAQMLSPQETIQLIHAAGGVAILSHPADKGRTHHTKHFMERVYALVDHLKKSGLDGIEAYSSHHTIAQTKALLTFAKQKQLLVTGGSDFHGPTWHREIALGEACISLREFQRLVRYSTCRSV